MIYNILRCLLRLNHRIELIIWLLLNLIIKALLKKFMNIIFVFLIILINIQILDCIGISSFAVLINWAINWDSDNIRLHIIYNVWSRTCPYSVWTWYFRPHIVLILMRVILLNLLFISNLNAWKTFVEF